MSRTGGVVVLFCCLCIGICVSGGRQALGQEGDADAQRIAAAIQKLGARDFEEREQAVEDVLDIGLPALPALKEAVEGRDPEVALRAAKAIRYLRLGITSDTPETVRKLAVGLAREEDERVLGIVQSKLVSSGAPGLRVLMFFTWTSDSAREKLGRIGRVYDYERGRISYSDEFAKMPSKDEALLDGDKALAETLVWLGGRADEIVMFHALEGTLDAAVQRAETFQSLCPTSQTAALLCALHLAKGDAEKALELALKAGDEAISDMLSLLIGEERWDELKGLMEGYVRMDVERDPSDVAEAHELLAVTAYMDGRADDVDASLKALRELMEKCEDGSYEKHRVAYSLVSASLMMGRIDEAVAVAGGMKDNFIGYLQQERGVVPFRDDNEGDNEEEEWQAAPKSIPDFDDLSDLDDVYGDFEDCPDKELLAKLAEKAEKLIRPDSTAEELAVLIVVENTAGREEKALELAKTVLGDGSDAERVRWTLAALSGGLQNSRQNILWWHLLGILGEDAASLDRCNRAISLSNGQVPEGELKPMLAKISQHVKEKYGAAEADGEDVAVEPEDTGIHSRRGVSLDHPMFAAATMQLLAGQYERFDDWAEALSCREFAWKHGGAVDDVARCGWLCVRLERFEDAAGHYRRALGVAADVGFAYPLSQCLLRTGQKEEGRKMLQLSRLMAGAYRSRLDMMMREWEDADGLALEEELAAALGGGRSIGWGDCSPVPLPAEVTGDFETALRERRKHCIAVLAGYGQGLQSVLMMRNCYDVARTCVGIEPGEGKAELEALMERVTAFAPGETEGIICLVNALDRLGHKDLGDIAYARGRQALFNRYGNPPTSDSGRNIIPWVAGSCRRDLDAALEMSKALCDENPGNDAYLDTLAQIHFSRGEFARAVELERKVVGDTPVGEDDGAMRRFWGCQLERFEKALAEQQAAAGAE